MHCKPAGDGQTVLKYLVAISNRRLLALEDHGHMANSRITFSYRTTDTGESKTMTLSVEALLQRFLQHVLPKGFVKVRYYGFFAPGCRQRLAALRQHLEHSAPTCKNLPQETDQEMPAAAPLCPECGQPMTLLRTIPTPTNQLAKLPAGRAPPCPQPLPLPIRSTGWLPDPALARHFSG